MLFVLIPITWLALVTLCWAACLLARRGDAAAQPNVDRSSVVGRGEVVQNPPEPSLQDTRLTAHGVR